MEFVGLQPNFTLHWTNIKVLKSKTSRTSIFSQTNYNLMCKRLDKTRIPDKFVKINVQAGQRFLHSISFGLIWPKSDFEKFFRKYPKLTKSPKLTNQLDAREVFTQRPEVSSCFCVNHTTSLRLQSSPKASSPPPITLPPIGPPMARNTARRDSS